MPLIRINSGKQGLVLHNTQHPAGRTLRSMVEASGPAIVMLHGFKYAPGSTRHCPHAKIFGARADSWPRALGFGVDNPNEGLGIAFGWQSRGSLRHMHKRATGLGAQIARLIYMLKRQRPHQPVHIIAHSLGAETALNSLQHLPSGAVDRMVLLSGASYLSTADTMLKTPAGRSVELLNVTSRENDLFDAAFRRLVPSPCSEDQAVGTGITAPNAATLRIDCPQVLDQLGVLGFHISSPTRRVCHWSSYQRPGVMELYRQFLRRSDTLPLCRLQEIKETVTPRWSRLITTGANPLIGKSALLPYPMLSLKWPEQVQSAAISGETKNDHAY